VIVVWCGKNIKLVCVCVSMCVCGSVVIVVIVVIVGCVSMIDGCEVKYVVVGMK